MKATCSNLQLMRLGQQPLLARMIFSVFVILQTAAALENLVSLRGCVFSIRSGVGSFVILTYVKGTAKRRVAGNTVTGVKKKT